MIEIKDRTKCCGCTACQAVCPCSAISFREDVLGFPYPVVDTEKCIDCGLCEDVCDFTASLKSDPLKIGKLSVAAVRNTDEDVLKTSQSGGVFSALAVSVINQGGSVYGAAMNSDHSVSHKRAVSVEECKAFRGSKYVQSDMGDVFRQVKDDLSDGMKVLFSGTPCQVAGLVSCLPSGLQKNLFTVDFICHGVPSPAVWRDYVSYMGRKGELKKVCFRDKEAAGWKEHKESFEYADGKKILRETYRVLFYKNIMLRHSCGVCPYDGSRRKSDVTIADFWGIEEILPELDSTAGVSMVISRSERGQGLLDSASASLAARNIEVSEDFLFRKNPNLLRPASVYHERQAFEDSYAEKGFIYAARRWGDMGWRYKAWQMKVFMRKITGLK